MEQIIESKNNKIIKLCNKLQNKKYRDKENMYLIEGPNLLEEAIKTGQEIVCVLVDEAEHRASEVLTHCQSINIVSHSIFKEIADTQNSQGIIALVRRNHEDLNSCCQLLNEGGNALVMDLVQDPGNVGTIIRTCDAAGYRCIFMIKGSCDVYSPKVVRAAAGSLFRVPIFYVDYEQCKKILREAKKKIITTDLKATKTCFDVDLTSDIALVVGNEGNGVSNEAKEMADEIIKIPMKGNIESLNVAVAAGIIMFESAK